MLGFGLGLFGNCVDCVAVICNLNLRYFQKGGGLEVASKNIEFLTLVAWLLSGLVYLPTVLIGYLNPDHEDFNLDNFNLDDPNLEVSNHEDPNLEDPNHEDPNLEGKVHLSSHV